MIHRRMALIMLGIFSGSAIFAASKKDPFAALVAVRQRQAVDEDEYRALCYKASNNNMPQPARMPSQVLKLEETHWVEACRSHIKKHHGYDIMRERGWWAYTIAVYAGLASVSFGYFTADGTFSMSTRLVLSAVYGATAGGLIGWLFNEKNAENDVIEQEVRKREKYE